MKSVCVFCGSNPGVRPAYLTAARALGAAIAKRGWTLVYGGASVGLMGAVADAAIAAGGHVVGIIPQALVDREVAHTGLPEQHVVDSMHTRKAMMADRADAFIALPGGIGTLEELFEVLTWRMLGIHHKPAGLLDVAGYYGSLVAFLDHAIEEGFLRRENLHLVLESEADALLDGLAKAHVPPAPKVLEPSET